MITDRDPGDESDAKPRPSERDRVLTLVADAGALSQAAMERLYEMQRQHHQGQRHERPKLRAA